MLIGKILVPTGAEVIEELISNIPFPFVVVHSGYTTRQRSGYRCNKEERSVRSVDDGWVSGYENARRIACKRDIRRTFCVDGYTIVNMGSNTAAR